MDENAGDVRGQHVERASKFLSEEFGFERNSMKESVFFISAKDSLDVHQGSMKIGGMRFDFNFPHMFYLYVINICICQALFKLHFIVAFSMFLKVVVTTAVCLYIDSVYLC